MSRFRAIAPLAVLALAAVAGCSDEDGARPAATVDGTEITAQEVVDELEAIRANEDYLAIREAEGPVLGEEEGTFDRNFVANILSTRILYTIAQGELEARGIEVSDACSDAAEGFLAQQVGGQEVLDAFEGSYRDYLVERFAAVIALQSDLAGYPCVIEDDEQLLERYFEEHPELFERNLCVSSIQVTDAAVAQEIDLLLAGGGDFDTIAAERSEVPAESQCGTESGLVDAVPEVGELEPGERTGVIEFQGSFLVIRLDEVEEPTFENSRDAIVQAIGGEIELAFGEVWPGVLESADVDVDPRYGTWDPGTGEIARPTEDVPADTTLPLDAEG